VVAVAALLVVVVVVVVVVWLWFGCGGADDDNNVKRRPHYAKSACFHILCSSLDSKKFSMCGREEFL